MKLRQKRQDLSRYPASARPVEPRRRDAVSTSNHAGFVESPTDSPVTYPSRRWVSGLQPIVILAATPAYPRPAPSNLHRLPSDAMHRWNLGRLRQGMHEDNPLPRETSRPFTARGIRFFFPARAAGDDRAPGHVRGRLGGDGDAGRFLRTLRPADPARSLRLNPLHQAGLDRAYRRAIRPPPSPDHRRTGRFDCIHTSRHDGGIDGQLRSSRVSRGTRLWEGAPETGRIVAELPPQTRKHAVGKTRGPRADHRSEQDARKSTTAKLELATAEFEGLALGPIDIQRSQIMAAATWTKPVKCAVRRS